MGGNLYYSLIHRFYRQDNICISPLFLALAYLITELCTGRIITHFQEKNIESMKYMEEYMAEHYEVILRSIGAFIMLLIGSRLLGKQTIPK